MAERECASPPESAPPSEAINQLRNLAKQHLQEINEERIQEQKDEEKKMQDLERYARHRQRDKESTDTSISDTPSPRMRSAQDVLNRLQWDTDLDISRYLIGYLERFEGIKEIPARNWISESTDEEWIPQHRIKYFKRISEDGDREIVWDRERRIDKIFGSGATSSTIDDHDKVDVVSEDSAVRL